MKRGRIETPLPKETQVFAGRLMIHPNPPLSVVG